MQITGEVNIDKSTQKNLISIKGIHTVCNNKYGICADLYSISSAEYNSYIQPLLKSGYINQSKVEGQIYYNITADGVNMLRN